MNDIPTILSKIDEALAKLEQEHPEVSRLVKLGFFAGVPLKDAAPLLGMMPASTRCVVKITICVDALISS